MQCGDMRAHLFAECHFPSAGCGARSEFSIQSCLRSEINVFNIPTIEDNAPFKVLGIYGEFTVEPAKWKVCHFSTYASSSKASPAGNSASLLAELKPMRERVKPKDISDMSALLQRDLNDVRVAGELVPYLLENHAQIGLFPAVLCALLPVGFLEDSAKSGEQNEYPDCAAPSPLVSVYGSCWKLTRFPNEKSEPTALGELWIDPSVTDVVVLDGQHRANAFRFATNAFPDATRPDSIYYPFYKDRHPSKSFGAELPVTVVWFQRLTDEKIDPKLISRRLFVDVNTNAKPVNQSRNILLDDVNPAAIFAGIFYSELAKNSFSASQLSLLHGAFDSESDQSRSVISLFSPAAIEYALRLVTLGLDRCDGIDYLIARDRSKDHQNTARLLRFFENLSAELQQQIDKSHLLSSLHQPAVRIGVAQSAIGYVYRLLSEFSLFKTHIATCLKLESAISAGEWSNSSRISVWDRVYCGGEGLFSSLRSEAIGQGVAPYVSAINEIEDKFRDLRILQGGLKGDGVAAMVRDAYVGACSIAGITAIVMAAAKVSESTGWAYTEKGCSHLCIEDVLEALNKSSFEQWIVILTEFRKGVVPGGLEPKRWPLIRNIYLRVIENNSNGKFSFFNSSLSASPDFRFVEESFKAERREFVSVKSKQPSPGEELKLRKRALKKLDNCLAKCGLKPIIPVEFSWPEGAQLIDDNGDLDSSENAYDDDDDVVGDVGTDISLVKI